MKSRIFTLLAMAVWLAVSASSGLMTTAYAGLLAYDDFNGLATGNLSGKGSGAGWSGNWTSSTSPKVVNGDLTYANYFITQSGDTRRISALDDSNDRQCTRDLAEPMTGTVWFSFLAFLDTSNATFAGITFNRHATNVHLPDSAAFGVTIRNTPTLRIRRGTTNNTVGSPALGQTHLILGKMIVGVGEDSVSIWLNPNLTAVGKETDLGTPIFTDSSMDILSSITNVGVANRGTSSFVDVIRVSNRETAFQDVTGVVSPAAGTVFIIK